LIVTATTLTDALTAFAAIATVGLAAVLVVTLIADLRGKSKALRDAEEGFKNLGEAVLEMRVVVGIRTPHELDLETFLLGRELSTGAITGDRIVEIAEALLHERRPFLWNVDPSIRSAHSETFVNAIRGVADRHLSKKEFVPQETLFLRLQGARLRLGGVPVAALEHVLVRKQRTEQLAGMAGASAVSAFLQRWDAVVEAVTHRPAYPDRRFR
jgi:hypothetical protein